MKDKRSFTNFSQCMIIIAKVSRCFVKNWEFLIRKWTQLAFVISSCVSQNKRGVCSLSFSYNKKLLSYLNLSAKQKIHVPYLLQHFNSFFFKVLFLFWVFFCFVFILFFGFYLGGGVSLGLLPMLWLKRNFYQYI